MALGLLIALPACPGAADDVWGIECVDVGVCGVCVCVPVGVKMEMCVLETAL
eukprot:m.97430 g.97430  ORF g.97430 m.97430 type:complete len:52 (-) comp13977_c0_seq1:25-180(-)